MVKFNPAKLTVTYKGVSALGPICPRRYTLTHSDKTGDLFLTIELGSPCQELNPVLDEVAAKWDYRAGTYSLLARVHVDSTPPSNTEAQKRFGIFNQQLPLALEAIRYGDRRFFNCHSELDYAPIFVHFQSVYPKFDTIKYFGQPLDYLFIC